MGNFSNLSGKVDGFYIYPDDVLTIKFLNSIISYKGELLFTKKLNNKAYNSITSKQSNYDEYKMMTFENKHTLSLILPGDLFSTKLPRGDWLSCSYLVDFKWDRTIPEWNNNSKYNYFYLDSQSITLKLLMDIFQLNLNFSKYNFQKSGYGFELKSGAIEIGYKITEIPIFWRYFKLDIEPRVRYDFVVLHDFYNDDNGILLRYDSDFNEKNKLALSLAVDLTIGKATSFETLIHFKVVSENKKMDRYYTAYDKSTNRSGLQIFFEDLLNSFGLSGDKSNDKSAIQRRRDSPFKLAYIEASLDHKLCDWKLTFKYTGRPEEAVINGQLTGRYNWENTFEFYVTWAVTQKNQLLKLFNKTKINEKYEKGEWVQPVLSLDPNEY